MKDLEERSPKVSSKVEIGKYVVTKRGSTNIDYSKTYEESNITENDVALYAYEIAPKVYYKKNWYGTSYTVDDFTQDAAMYIVDLFRRQYFSAEEKSIKSIIYRMIDGFFLINKYREIRKESSRKVSLDIPLNGEDGSTLLDLTKDGTIEDTMLQDKIGIEIIHDVIDRMNPVPYKTNKYKYFGTYNGRFMDLSEKSLAMLIFKGYDMHSILSVYNKDTNNIGSCSMASYIFHKVKSTVKKISSLLEEIDTEYKEYLEKYYDIKSGISQHYANDEMKDTLKPIK